MLTRRHGPRQLLISGSATPVVGCPIDDESFDGQGAVGAGGGQHRVDLVTQRDIEATRLSQDPSARLNGLGVRELEQLLDPLPVHVVHDLPPHDRGKWL